MEFWPSHCLPPVIRPYRSIGQLCCSHLEKLLTMPVSLYHLFILRVLNGTILLANSKPHSPVLEAGKRNYHFLDNMWGVETLHPTFFGFLSKRNNVWMLGTTNKKSMCLVQIVKKHLLHPHVLTHGKHAQIDLGYLQPCKGRGKHMLHSLHLRSHFATFLYGWRC